MSAPGTPKASQAAITAVQEALGCRREVWPHDTSPAWCDTHWEEGDDAGSQWTERGCPVAVAAADAAAPHNAAQALRDAASAWQSGEGFTVMTPRGVGIPAIDYAQRTLDWLRERADRLEAGQ